MIKTFCDKCGKEISEWDAIKLTVEYPCPSDIEDEHVYHLCPDCANKLDLFLHNEL